MPWIRLNESEVRFCEKVSDRRWEAILPTLDREDTSDKKDYFGQAMMELATLKLLEIDYDWVTVRRKDSVFSSAYPAFDIIRPFHIKNGQIELKQNEDDYKILVPGFARFESESSLTVFISGYISILDAKTNNPFNKLYHAHIIPLSQLGKSSELIRHYELYKLDGEWRAQTSN